MQELCSESLNTLVTVAKMVWESTEVSSSFQGFRSSSGNRLGNPDEERDMVCLATGIEINHLKS